MMALNLRIISFNCHTFNKNHELIGSSMLECNILYLQETMLDANASIGIQDICEDFNVAYVPAVRADDRFTGRSSGGLAILWRRKIICKVYPVSFSSRMSGLKLVNGECVYPLLNIYAFYDYGNTEILINYKSHMAELSSIYTIESFTDVITVSDFNSDPNKGRFNTELTNLTNAHAYFVSDVERLPPDCYFHLSANVSAGSSWFDHVLVSRSNLAINHKMIYGCSFYDHTPLYFEAVMNIQVDVHYIRRVRFPVDSC